jgi:hypothetical protein
LGSRDDQAALKDTVGKSKEIQDAMVKSLAASAPLEAAKVDAVMAQAAAGAVQRLAKKPDNQEAVAELVHEIARKTVEAMSFRNKPKKLVRITKILRTWQNRSRLQAQRRFDQLMI